MEKHKIDSFIKEKLEEKRILPSEKLWESLEKKLDRNRSKRKLRAFIFGAAAVFTLLVGLGSLFLFQKPQRNPIEKKQVFTPLDSTLVKNPLNINFPEKPSDSYFSKKTSKLASLKTIRPRNMVSFKIHPNRSLVNLKPITTPFETGYTHVELNQDSLLDLETEELIRIAYAKLDKYEKEKSRKREEALSLLFSIEQELNTDTYLKQKVIEIIKNSYSKINIAQNENN